MSDEARRARRDLGATLLVVGAVLALVLARHLFGLLSPRPSEEACRELVERYLRDKSRARFPTRDERELAHLTDETASPSEKQADVAACQKTLSASQVRCALGAASIDALERCMQ